MKIIGNIVSNKIVEYDSRVKTVSSLDEIIHGLPTLIIGWERTKELFPDNYYILNKEIKDNYFWTYSLSEKRSENEVDIEQFIQHCYENVVSEIEYLFVDPIQFKFSSLKKTIRKLYSIDKPISLIYRDFIYVYGDNIVFGIDLHLCEHFFGIPKDKIKSKIKSLSNGFLLDEKILIEYKDYLGRLNTPKFIPYLYFKENG